LEEDMAARALASLDCCCLGAWKERRERERERE
jgi:hypothetical protein